MSDRGAPATTFPEPQSPQGPGCLVITAAGVLQGTRGGGVCAGVSCVPVNRDPHRHRGLFQAARAHRGPRHWLTHPTVPVGLFLYLWWKTPNSVWQALWFSQLAMQKTSPNLAYLHKPLNKGVAVAPLRP